MAALPRSPACLPLTSQVTIYGWSTSLHPELAGELDIEATGRTADQIIAGGGKKMAWCPVADDHRWWTVASSPR